MLSVLVEARLTNTNVVAPSVVFCIMDNLVIDCVDFAEYLIAIVWFSTVDHSIYLFWHKAIEKSLSGASLVTALTQRFWWHLVIAVFQLSDCCTYNNNLLKRHHRHLSVWWLLYRKLGLTSNDLCHRNIFILHYWLCVDHRLWHLLLAYLHTTLTAESLVWFKLLPTMDTKHF